MRDEAGRDGMTMGGGLAAVRRWIGGVTMAAALTLAPSAAMARPAVSELVLDAASGRVLFARDAGRARAPASLTKLMTLYLAFDALRAGRLKPREPIAISRRAAAQQPSKLGIAAGRTIPLDAALRVIAVQSANDVAVALAERLAGSEAAFARQMTRAAHRLGMRDTRFANATGLPNRGNVTTADDIATLSLAMLRNHASHYKLFATRSVRWKQRVMPNHNHLLGKIPGVDGIKTGYTADAGYNLAASAKRRNRRIVAVVLGERSAAARDTRVANLIEVGFTSLATRRGAEPRRTARRSTRGRGVAG